MTRYLATSQAMLRMSVRLGSESAVLTGVNKRQPSIVLVLHDIVAHLSKRKYLLEGQPHSSDPIAVQHPGTGHVAHGHVIARSITRGIITGRPVAD